MPITYIDYCLVRKKWNISNKELKKRFSLQFYGSGAQLDITEIKEQHRYRKLLTRKSFFIEFSVTCDFIDSKRFEAIHNNIKANEPTRSWLPPSSPLLAPTISPNRHFYEVPLLSIDVKGSSITLTLWCRGSPLLGVRSSTIVQYVVDSLYFEVARLCWMVENPNTPILQIKIRNFFCLHTQKWQRWQITDNKREICVNDICKNDYSRRCQST